MRISDWSSDVCSSDLLIARAVEAGGTHAVYGGSVQSPAVARVATMAGLMGVPVTIVIGATTAAKALPKHAPVRLAYEAGAEFREIRVGYNPALQKEADRLAEQPGWFQVGYGDRKSTRLNSSH